MFCIVIIVGCGSGSARRHLELVVLLPVLVLLILLVLIPVFLPLVVASSSPRLLCEFETTSERTSERAPSATISDRVGGTAERPG
jgi:hypothetical protein